MECCRSAKISSPSFSSIVKLQGSSLPPGRKFSRDCLNPLSPSCTLPKPFLQINNIKTTFLYGNSSSRLSSRTCRATISAEAWDLGRFFRTLYFFDALPSPAKFVESIIEKLSGPSPEKPAKAMEASDYILVAGATGGVGKRVVDILQKKGLPVRALVRNEEKARRLLGSDIQLDSLV